MLSILERDGLSHPLTVIFSSDNFKSIFEGVDLSRHKSLNERFMTFNFEKCKHGEIIDYVMFYNERFRGTAFYRELRKSELSTILRKDATLTLRTLNRISIENHYDALAIIKVINDSIHGVIEDAPTPTVKANNRFSIIDEYSTKGEYDI
jgi:hypothetical protein